MNKVSKIISNPTEDCPNCLGAGTIYNGNKIQKCRYCKGEGKVNGEYIEPIIDSIREQWYNPQ